MNHSNFCCKSDEILIVPIFAVINHLDFPIALVRRWVPPAPGIVPAFQISKSYISFMNTLTQHTNCNLRLTKFSFLSSIDDVTHHGNLWNGSNQSS